MPQKNKRLSSYTTVPEDRSEQRSPTIVRAYEQTGELVRSHPGSSALVTFGIGFGVGLVLTLLLAPTPRRRTSWIDEHLPDWMPRRPLSRLTSHFASR